MHPGRAIGQLGTGDRGRAMITEKRADRCIQAGLLDSWALVIKPER